MPVYEYQHDGNVDCKYGEIFEVEQPITDEALKICPGCGNNVHKL